MEPYRLDGRLQGTPEFEDVEGFEREAVQRGLRSRTYRQGRYSVKRENGVHHFHGLLSEYLRDAGGPQER